MLAFAQLLNGSLLAQDHGDYCYFAMTLDNRGPVPQDLGTEPAALLISVIDYSNIYIPTDWESRLAKTFIARSGDLGIDYKVVTSGIVLNKSNGDADLAKRLKSLGVKNIVLYTVVYQRTPEKIKTGHTVAIMPFTGEASIVDMAGSGHWYSGPTLIKTLDYLRKDLPLSGDFPKPEFIGLSSKDQVAKAVRGMPVFDKKSKLFMHGYYGVCVADHAPSDEKWATQFETLKENNESVEDSRKQLADLLDRYDQKLRFLYLSQELKASMGENDYIIVPIDDPLEVIQVTFMPAQGKGMMRSVPHDLNNPYYQFGLLHPESGTLYVPELPSRGYGEYFQSLEDLLKLLPQK